MKGIEALESRSLMAADLSVSLVSSTATDSYEISKKKKLLLGQDELRPIPYGLTYS